MKTIKLKKSQSAIKSFYDQGECKIVFDRKYIKGDRRENPSDAMIKGQIFEHELIGGTRDGNVPSLPLIGIKSLKPPKSATKAKKIDYLVANHPLSNKHEDYENLDSKLLDVYLERSRDVFSGGKKSTDQIRVEDLANQWKPKLEEWGVVIDTVQAKLEYEDYEGHADIIGFVNGEKAIIDVKYTETSIDDRWNGWGSPEEKDHIQAKHYVWLYWKMTGEWIKFYYLVFGKSGWVKFIWVDLTELSMTSHEILLDKFDQDLANFQPTPINDFNKCKDCLYADDCEFKTINPLIQSIQI